MILLKIKYQFDAIIKNPVPVP